MLEPIPETRKALATFLPLDEPDFGEKLTDMGERARKVVPEIVGMSVGLIEAGLTFTLATPDLLASELDAAQYVDGEGPCLAAVDEAVVVSADMDSLLDEGRWQLFAQAASARGVASSLSMPVMRGGQVVGGVNVYASTPDAFAGHEEALGAVLGAAAEHAVANADLSFSTRLAAVDTPQRLLDNDKLETAVGMVAVRFGESVGDARDRIRRAAAQSGLTESAVANVLVAVHLD
ncbi:GAF domain-containing protein [Nocardioides bigeumensis]|uniref:GAF domain-containing protein n=1 Tax=Nocardioides bigeumensis TaxID=433657 RepID=A0ABN2XMH3_9ACTN